MDDPFFIAKLSTHKLLPDNTSSQLEALQTQAHKVSYFLNHVIKPSLDVEDNSGFDNLVSVMEQCGYDHVKRIASEIKSETSKANNIESGMFARGYIHIILV